MAAKYTSTYDYKSLEIADDIDNRICEDIKYAHIIDLIAEKQHMPLQKSKSILYHNYCLSSSMIAPLTLSVAAIYTSPTKSSELIN